MENWKAIPGYEGRYEVSDLGRVRSVSRLVRAVSKAGNEYMRKMPSTVLRPGRCRGYLIVNLSGAGTISVHILVALAFCPGQREGLEVNHRDGDKHNCRAVNLEWVSKRRNMEHAVDNGLNTQAVRVVSPHTGIAYPSMARAAKAENTYHSKVASWSRA